MKIIVVIPERMSSSRFPGKPMAKICGIPMVAHIFERSKFSGKVEGVYVATPDQEILDFIRSRGGNGGLERTTSINAPTTVKMALPEIEVLLGSRADWVIMVQGDEPMIQHEIIDDLIDCINSNPEAKTVNVVTKINKEEEYYDENIVKIVLNQKKEGMWFFRIPSERWRGKLDTLPIMKQTGIIAFSREFLMTFGIGEKKPLEKVESVDMLRVVEEGETVPVVVSRIDLYSVDTEDDLINVEKIMQKDPLLKIYESKYQGQN